MLSSETQVMTMMTLDMTTMTVRTVLTRKEKHQHFRFSLIVLKGIVSTTLWYCYPLICQWRSLI